MIHISFRTIQVFLIVATLLAPWSYNSSILADERTEGAVRLSLDQPSNGQGNQKEIYKPTVYKNHQGMRFVLIQPGKFSMGSPPQEAGRTIFESQNEIVIEKPFYMQTTEVTQRQWKEVMGDNPSYFSDCGDNCPVENISWKDVQGFIKALQSIDSSSVYRLPTEAEWEYVCRSGSTAMYSSGDLHHFECHLDDLVGKMAWYDCNSQGRTHPVAQKEPNKWGVYDMHGNVNEWCQDVYVINYAQILTGNVDVNDVVADRAVRSCSFGDCAVSCRSAARINLKPDIRTNRIGFRLVREPVFYKIEIEKSGETIEVQKLKEKDSTIEKPPGQAGLKEVSKENLFCLQVAATRNVEAADRLVTRLKQMRFEAYKIEVDIPGKGTWYRVRVGSFDKIENAQQIQLKLAEKKIMSIVVKNSTITHED